MKERILTKAFEQSLVKQGFSLQDIKAEIAGNNEQKVSPVKVIRNWTGLTDKEIREGLFNEDRDVISPKVNDAILGLIKPWTKTRTTQGLPELTVKQISRSTQIAPEKVIRVLLQYPLPFSVNGSNFTALVQKPEFPSSRLGLADCAKYRLSPVRIARAARYLSRSPGGGPVQRAGIQDRNIDNLIRKGAWALQRISFIQIAGEEKRNDN